MLVVDTKRIHMHLALNILYLNINANEHKTDSSHKLMCRIELLLIKIQVLDLRSKTFLIWDQNPKDLDLVFHWVSRFIHLTQIDLINWLATLWIINEFEKVNSHSLSSNSLTTYNPVTKGTFATLFQIKIMQFIDKRDAHRSHIIIWAARQNVPAAGNFAIFSQYFAGYSTGHRGVKLDSKFSPFLPYKLILLEWSYKCLTHVTLHVWHVMRSCFIWATILSPQVALGFSSERGMKCRVKIRTREETVPCDLDRCAQQQLVTEVIKTRNDKAVDCD